MALIPSEVNSFLPSLREGRLMRTSRLNGGETTGLFLWPPLCHAVGSCVSMPYPRSLQSTNQIAPPIASNQRTLPQRAVLCRQQSKRAKNDSALICSHINTLTPTPFPSLSFGPCPCLVSLSLYLSRPSPFLHPPNLLHTLPHSTCQALTSLLLDSSPIVSIYPLLFSRSIDPHYSAPP